MKAKFQIALFYGGLLLVVLHIVLGYYFLMKWNDNNYRKMIPYHTGIITDSFSEDYSCGKHKRRTCTRYGFVIDEQIYDVSESEFKTHRKGQSFTLYKIENHTPFYATYFIFSILPLTFGSFFFIFIFPSSKD